MVVRTDLVDYGMSSLGTQDDSVRAAQCIRCGYELPMQSGTPACPECGEVAPDKERSRAQLEMVSFGCGLAIAGLVLAAASWAEANGSLFSQGSLDAGGQRLLAFGSALLLSLGCLYLSGVRRGKDAGVVFVWITCFLFIAVSGARFGAGWFESGIWALFNGYMNQSPSSAIALVCWCVAVLSMSYCVFWCAAVSARVVGLSRFAWRSVVWALPATIIVAAWLLSSGVELFVSSLAVDPVRHEWWLNNVQWPLQRAAPTITILLLSGALIVLVICRREARSRLHWWGRA